MLQLDTPQDLVIATVRTDSLKYFVAEAFSLHGLDWCEYVDVSEEFIRPTDIAYSGANSTCARGHRLGSAYKDATGRGPDGRNSPRLINKKDAA